MSLLVATTNGSPRNDEGRRRAIGIGGAVGQHRPSLAWRVLERGKINIMSEFKSWRSFWDFDYAVRRKLRYVRTPEHDDFLKAVAETNHTRKVRLNQASTLWRARLGHGYQEVQHNEDTFEVECAYSPDQMKPLPNKAYEGRVNPKGIPCLYLANRKETAVSEVRPWIGSHVSVGQFKILRDVELIDCSRGHSSAPKYFFFEDPKLTPAEVEKVRLLMATPGAIKHGVSRLTAEGKAREEQIAQMREKGMSQAAIGKELGITNQRVSQIIQRIIKRSSTNLHRPKKELSE